MSDPRAYTDANPLGLACSGGGAALVALAVFLPQAESKRVFGGIAQNTLLQNGDGWVFLAIAAGIAVATYWCWSAGGRNLWGAVLGLAAVGFAIYHGTGDRLALYGPGGGFTEYANPGIGLYVAGLGGALAVVGGTVLGRPSPIKPLSPN